MAIRVALAGLLVVGAAGCSSTSVYRAIYDALHAREEVLNPPSTAGSVLRRPDYAEYEAERQRLRDERDRAARPPDRQR